MFIGWIEDFIGWLESDDELGWCVIQRVQAESYEPASGGGERERESAQGGRSDATLLLSLERERERDATL